MRGLLASIGLVSLASAVWAAEPGVKPPPRRADAFLGIHFDFHAGADCNKVGQNTTPEMVAKIIERVKPDYIQIDCKGHPGYSSYPTKVGNPAPGFVGDPLRVWREATRIRGVALFMHYSGVWDGEAVKHHPEWAIQQADGKPSPRITSVFGPYVDQLMIPQLRELAGVYGVDGVWVDGDCWAAAIDYTSSVVQRFCDQAGVTQAPRKSADPKWQEWKEFHREGFRRYLRHYVDAMKASHPDFQVISNWAFSDHMPEAVSAGVTALSGDFSPMDSVNSARFAGRCLENQGRPWDLMSWSFITKPRKQKTAIQLQQEAAIVLALGGGYQAYFTMNRDGSVRLPEMDVMAEVARFCRARQAFCHHSQAVPQAGLVYSRAGHYHAANGLFHPSGSEGIGILRQTLKGLLGQRSSVEIISEHTMASRGAKCPVLVVPGWDYLEDAFRDELVNYAKGGGRLLLVGPKTVKLFAGQTGIQDGAAVAAPRPLGAGRVAAVPSPKELPNVKDLFADPIVLVSGPGDVDVYVRRLGAKMTINLVNTSGRHADPKAEVLETIPMAGPLEVSILLPKQPRSIVAQPEGTKLPVAWANGRARVTLPQLAIHTILVVEE